MKILITLCLLLSVVFSNAQPSETQKVNAMVAAKIDRMEFLITQCRWIDASKETPPVNNTVVVILADKRYNEATGEEATVFGFYADGQWEQASLRPWKDSNVMPAHKKIKVSYWFPLPIRRAEN